MQNKRLPTSTYSPRSKGSKRPYEQAQWSFGWSKSPQHSTDSPTINRYHNESNFRLTDSFNPKDQARKLQLRNRKTEEYNAKLPTYDPKNGRKTNIYFGQGAIDTPTKIQRALSPRVPPGGRSQIIFG